MRLGIRPERDFGAVKKLQRGGAPDTLGAGGSDPVAGIELVEIEFLGIGRAGRGPHVVATALVVAFDHFEQILRRLILMRENKDTQADIAAGTMIETGTDIGRTSLLAAFEDQGPHLASRGPLRFKSLVDIGLGPIEDQRLDRASLGPDLEVLRGKEFQAFIATNFLFPALDLLLQVTLQAV